MTIYTNNAEGGSNGTSATTANQTGSGTGFTIAKGGTPAVCVYSNTQKAHGALSYSISTTTNASDTVQLQTPAISTNNLAFRVYFYYSGTMPSASHDLVRVRVGTTIIVTAQMQAGNTLTIFDVGSGTVKAFTTVLAPGTWYRLEGVIGVGTTASNGTVRADLYLLDSTTPLEAGVNLSNRNTGTAAITNVLFGKVSVGAAVVNNLYMDDIAWNDAGTTYIGPVPGAPTAAFTSSVSGLTATFDSSTSTAAGSATITGQSWSFGDGNTGAGSNPSHTYSTAGTYTVILSVTDSNGNSNSTSHTVTVAPPGATVTPSALYAPSYTVTGGAPDAVTAVTDSDASTFLVGSGTVRAQLPAMATPTAGSDVTVTVEMDRTGSTTGTASAKLYEGGALSSLGSGTLRSSMAAQPLTSAAVGSNTSTIITFTIPAADAATVTGSAWVTAGALFLEFTQTVS